MNNLKKLWKKIKQLLGNNSCQQLQSLKISTVALVRKRKLSSRMTHSFYADNYGMLLNTGLERVLPCLKNL